MCFLKTFLSATRVLWDKFKSLHWRNLFHETTCFEIYSSTTKKHIFFGVSSHMLPWNLTQNLTCEIHFYVDAVINTNAILIQAMTKGGWGVQTSVRAPQPLSRAQSRALARSTSKLNYQSWGLSFGHTKMKPWTLSVGLTKQSTTKIPTRQLLVLEYSHKAK